MKKFRSKSPSALSARILRPTTLIAFLAISTLSACGSSGSAGDAVGNPVAANTTSIGAGLVDLQQKGLLPTLDIGTSAGGPDTNGDGVRDDIEAFIAKEPDTDAQKNRQRQLAKALRSTLTLDTTEAVARNAAAQALLMAITCTWRSYDVDRAGQVISRLEAFSANTIIRIRAYEKFNMAMSGSQFDLPTKEACNVDAA